MVRQMTSAYVAIVVSKRAPTGASGPPGALSARRSANSTSSCKVTTVGNPICFANIGVNAPEKLDQGDFPKILAPKLNQMRSGFKRFRRDKMAGRAFKEPGCQQYSISVRPR